MHENIFKHLKEVYRPNAIILHGSRARGRERQNSDWDFIFLYNSTPEKEVGRELYEGHNIEFTSHTLPIDDVEKEFSSKLQNAKVIYEENGEATQLLNSANDFYAKGVYWSSEKISNHKLWMQGRIDGMKDTIDNPPIFLKYFSDLYPRVYSYWYWMLQHSHSQPVYMAIEEIEEKDPEYFILVREFADINASLETKVATAEKIRDYLFSI